MAVGHIRLTATLEPRGPAAAVVPVSPKRQTQVSRSNVPVWPAARPDSLVERVWREGAAGWPDYGAGLVIDEHLREPFGRASFPKTGPRILSSTSTSPASPSAKATRNTPWRATASVLTSGVRPIIAVAVSFNISPARAKRQL